MTATEFRLPRAGQTALAFTGQLLAEAHSRRLERKGNDRTWAIRLYRTAGGRIVAEVEYDTTWPREAPYRTAVVVNDLADAQEWFDTFDPLRLVRGYPVGAQFTERQQQLLADMQQRYTTAVGEVLAAAGAEERVD